MRQLVTLAALLLAAPAANAATQCQVTPQGELCVSEVDFAEFSQQVYQNQNQSQWCWAASVAMIFDYQGHPVDQARIVSEVYGSPVNMPAQAGIVIAKQLNRSWVDDFGATFTSNLTAAFDADYGYNGITNAQIVAELDGGNPLVIGARAHAMVLTAIQYYRTPQGPYIVGGGVFDPWPGVGPRGLAPDELTPVQQGGSLRFLAAVSVTTGGVAPATTPGWEQPERPSGPTWQPPAYENTLPNFGCAAGDGGAGTLVGVMILLGLALLRRGLKNTSHARRP